MSDIKVTDKRGQAKEAPKKVATETKSSQDKPSNSEKAGQNEYVQDIDFSSFIFSLSSSALIHLGLIENPETQKKEKNLVIAKQQIDLIEMLKAKSEGNRTEDEEKLITQVLKELKLRYVQES